jgi:uncharacterized Zn finger protein (UPF0148 family)
MGICPSCKYKHEEEEDNKNKSQVKNENKIENKDVPKRSKIILI